MLELTFWEDFSNDIETICKAIPKIWIYICAIVLTIVIVVWLIYCIQEDRFFWADFDKVEEEELDDEEESSGILL